MTPLILLAEGAPATASLRFLAADAPAATPTLPADAPAASPFGAMIMPLLFLGIFFLVFAPQMKRTKQHKKLLEELKSGDEIITSSGLFGTIAQVKPDRFVVEIAKGVKVEINRANVEMRVPSETPDPPADK